jgi:abhydrolase domain-containing protein 17
MVVTRKTLRRWLVGEFSVRRLVRSLLEVYIAILAFAYFFTDRIIFQPPLRLHLEDRDTYRIAVNGTDRITVLALTNSPAKFTVLYVHANAEDVSTIKFMMEDYRRHGFSVFAFDYRGYGSSDGKPSSRHAYQDTEAIFQHLVHDRGIRPEQIIIHGRSVGAAFAIYLAAHHKVAGLISESAFLTAFRVRTGIPIAPFDKMRNNKWIQEIRCPVLLMHGEADDIIPFWHGQKLFDLAPEPKLAYWVSGAGHNDLSDVAASMYWERIENFASLLERDHSGNEPEIAPSGRPPISARSVR